VVPQRNPAAGGGHRRAQGVRQGAGGGPVCVRAEGMPRGGDSRHACLLLLRTEAAAPSRPLLATACTQLNAQLPGHVAAPSRRDMFEVGAPAWLGHRKTGAQPQRRRRTLRISGRRPTSVAADAQAVRLSVDGSVGLGLGLGFGTSMPSIDAMPSSTTPPLSFALRCAKSLMWTRTAAWMRWGWGVARGQGCGRSGLGLGHGLAWAGLAWAGLGLALGGGQWQRTGCHEAWQGTLTRSGGVQVCVDGDWRPERAPARVSLFTLLDERPCLAPPPPEKNEFYELSKVLFGTRRNWRESLPWVIGSGEALGGGAASMQGGAQGRNQSCP
jgi:hypothetical protein